MGRRSLVIVDNLIPYKLWLYCQMASNTIVASSHNVSSWYLENLLLSLIFLVFNLHWTVLTHMTRHYSARPWCFAAKWPAKPRYNHLHIVDNLIRHKLWLCCLALRGMSSLQHMGQRIRSQEFDRQRPEIPTSAQWRIELLIKELLLSDKVPDLMDFFNFIWRRMALSSSQTRRPIMVEEQSMNAIQWTRRTWWPSDAMLKRTPEAGDRKWPTGFKIWLKKLKRLL